MSIWQRITKTLRRLNPLKLLQMQHGGDRRWWTDRLPRTKYDYVEEVGDKLASSTVMAPVLWIARTFPEAPVVLRRDEDIERDAPMLELLRKPNAFYSGTQMWMATILALNLGGNAYWLKVRDGIGAVTELWWVPPDMIEPRWPDTGDVFISHYEYKPKGETILVPPEDVVHLRWGIDPRNARKGMSPVDSVLREVFTDDEASNFTASLLRNGAVPGVVISPASDIDLDDDEFEATKEQVQTDFGGDNRGRPYVAQGPVKIQQYTWSPQQLDLAKIRNIPEERVCAVLGVPASVVGFGTGLEQTKVGATMESQREQAYESCIIPTQRMVAEDLQTQLVPDFEADPNAVLVEFDLSKVRVLQEDQNELAKRWGTLFGAGLVRRDTAKQALGIESDPGDEVYAIPASVRLVSAAASVEEQQMATGTSAEPEPEGETEPVPEELRAALAADIKAALDSHHARTLDRLDESDIRSRAVIEAAQQRNDDLVRQVLLTRDEKAGQPVERQLRIIRGKDGAMAGAEITEQPADGDSTG